MHKPQAVREARRLQRLRGCDQIGCAQAKFCVFPSRCGPLSSAFRREPDAHADHRLHAHLLGDLDDLEKFLQFLDDQHHLFPKLAPKERVLDKKRVFVAVANDQAFRIPVDGQCREKFGFRARFDSKMEGGARIDDFLNNLAKLVYFNGKYASVLRLVAHFSDGLCEGGIDFFHPVPQQVLKPEDHWKGQPSFLRLFQKFNHINWRRRVLGWQHTDMSFFVYRKISRSPTVNIVECDRRLDIPWGIHWRWIEEGRECRKLLAVCNVHFSSGAIFNNPVLGCLSVVSENELVGSNGSLAGDRRG